MFLIIWHVLPLLYFYLVTNYANVCAEQPQPKYYDDDIIIYMGESSYVSVSNRDLLAHLCSLRYGRAADHRGHSTAR